MPIVNHDDFVEAETLPVAGDTVFLRDGKRASVVGRSWEVLPNGSTLICVLVSTD